MSRLVAAAGLAAWLLASAAGAAYPGQDPDWPCQQRLVPALSAGTLWNGPEAGEDWHAEPQVVELVNRIVQREVTEDQGNAAIAEFVGPLDKDQRQKLVPLVFAGLLEQTNRQRSDVINRLKELGARQRQLAGLVDEANARLDTAPEADRRDLQERAIYLTRTYDASRRTVRYACEVPGEMESRLGAWARTLEAALR